MNLFGNKSTGFVTNTPSAPSFDTGTGLFGNKPTFTWGMKTNTSTFVFGANPAAVNLFGTTNTTSNPFRETTSPSGSSGFISDLCGITIKFNKLSLENYQAGRKGPYNSMAANAGGLFGALANPTPSTANGLFSSSGTSFSFKKAKSSFSTDTRGFGVTPGDLFGQPSKTNSLFKPFSQVTTIQNTDFSFGGTNTMGQGNKSSMGLSGNTAASQAGGLFGNTANTGMATGFGTGTGLFGQPNTGFGNNLFGNKSTGFVTNTPSAPSFDTGTGLFGNKPTFTWGMKTNTSTFGFGANPAGVNLFGTTNTTSNPFGGTTSPSGSSGFISDLCGITIKFKKLSLENYQAGRKGPYNSMAANAGGLFGASATPTPSTANGLFDSSGTSFSFKKAKSSFSTDTRGFWATPGGLFGQPLQTNSLFKPFSQDTTTQNTGFSVCGTNTIGQGNKSSMGLSGTTAASQAGGLFGNMANTGIATGFGTSTGLFGQPNTSFGNNLFGNKSTGFVTNTPSAPSFDTGTGLFGNKPTFTWGMKTNTSTFVFGANPAGVNLFGTTNTTSNPFRGTTSPPASLGFTAAQPDTTIKYNELKLKSFKAGRKAGRKRHYNQMANAGGLFGSAATPTSSTANGLFGSSGTSFSFKKAKSSFSTGMGLFGNKPTFTMGTKTNTSTFVFGANPAGVSLFGTTNTTSNSFGGTTSPSGSSVFTAAQPGTTIKFNPPTGSCTLVKRGVRTSFITIHQCITAMKEYEKESLEELRLEDYQAGRKGPSNPMADHSDGLFKAAAKSSFSTAQEGAIQLPLNKPICASIGDSPLFNDPLSNPKEEEELLKPTNPAAQEAPKIPEVYSVTPRPATRVRHKILLSSGTGKIQLFNKEDDDELSLNSGVIMPNLSADVEESQHAEVKGGADKDLQVCMLNTNSIDKPMPHTQPSPSLQDTIHEVNTRGTISARNSLESLEDKRVQIKRSKELESQKAPHPAGTVLTRLGYYILSMEELGKMLCIIWECVINNITKIIIKN